MVTRPGRHALIMVTDVLRETFCESFIARIGGDEFLAVVLGPRNESELAELGERFLTNLQRAIDRNEKFAVLSAALVSRPVSSWQMWIY